MLLSTLKIPLEEEEQEVAGGGAAVPERVERGAAEVEGTSIEITGAAENWGLRSVISLSFMKSMPMTFVDVSYAASQAHKIVNVALHRKYSPGIVFIFFQGRKYLYHV
jgi:hypothetical protein